MQAISTCAYNENMAKRERKILSLKEKVELIKLQKSAGRSQRDLAEQFGNGKSTSDFEPKSLTQYMYISLVLS